MREAPRLKLFVWCGFCPDYTEGLAFALAPDVAEAQRLIEAERGYAVSEWGRLTELDLDTKAAFSVPGGG